MPRRIKVCARPASGAAETYRDEDLSSRRLLKGTCSLGIDGPSFVPVNGEGRTYSLVPDDETRDRMIELLRAEGWESEFEAFEAEFWGTLSWHGYHRLDAHGGTANADELVSVQFSKSEPVEPEFQSIRERIRRFRANSSP